MIAPTTSTPDMPGMSRSSITRSGWCALAMSMARMASAATALTSKPSWTNAARNASRNSSASSTITTDAISASLDVQDVDNSCVLLVGSSGTRHRIGQSGRQHKPDSLRSQCLHGRGDRGPGRDHIVDKDHRSQQCLRRLEFRGWAVVVTACPPRSMKGRREKVDQRHTLGPCEPQTDLTGRVDAVADLT